MSEQLTNGDVIGMAIRDHNNTLQYEMDKRFKEWCKENKESPMSMGAKKYWKTLRFVK